MVRKGYVVLVDVGSTKEELKRPLTNMTMESDMLYGIKPVV